MAVAAERGAKETQQRGTPGVEGPRRDAIEQEPADVPNQAAKPVAQAEGGSRVCVGMALGRDMVRGTVMRVAGHCSIRLVNDGRGRLRPKPFKDSKDEGAVPPHIVTPGKGDLGLLLHRQPLFEIKRQPTFQKMDSAFQGIVFHDAAAIASISGAMFT